MKTIEEQKQLLSKVFSPMAPIKEESFFRGRIEQLKRIVAVMNEDGQHAILFGERGVGKTSMANITQRHITNLYSVKITCNSNDDFKSLWTRALDGIQSTKTIKGIGFHAETKSKMVTLGTSVRSIVDLQPHDIYNCLNQFPVNKFLFIFDEFDNIKSQPTRVQFADLIKSLSDNSTNIKIMIVGIAENVTNLIGNHQSLERCLMQIKMPRMSEDELAEIISKGFGELEMEVTKQVTNKIIKFSSGFPHYTHLLCKYSIKNALDNNRYKVNSTDLEFAISKALENASEQLRVSYRAALLSPSENSNWKKLVYSCATCYSDQFDSFTLADIRTAYNKLTSEAISDEDLQSKINGFCEEERGLMLEVFGSGTNARYKFYNPMMKPYVLLNMENDN